MAVLGAAMLIGTVGLTGCGGEVTVTGLQMAAQPMSDQTTAGQSVSGQSVPTGDLPDWRLVFTDDFDRPALGEQWSTYQGSPGGDPYSHWDPAQVRLTDGALVLAAEQRAGQWITGGVSNWPVTQTYGRWEVRFRADPSDEITYHFLLWPQQDSWPPEIDFLEDFSGDRSSASAFVHYELDGRQKVQRDLSAVDGVPIDLTRWHTAGVEWLPGQVRFLLDGRVWSDVSGDFVPDIPMWLALQAQSGGCQRKSDFGMPDCPVAGVPATADVQIDWVAVYERA